MTATDSNTCEHGRSLHGICQACEQQERVDTGGVLGCQVATGAAMTDAAEDLAEDIMDAVSVIASAMKYARELLKLSRSQMGTKLGVSKICIALIETGKRHPSLPTTMRLVNLLRSIRK